MSKAWKFLSGIIVVAMAVFLAIVLTDNNAGRLTSDAEPKQETVPEGHATVRDEAVATSSQQAVDSPNATPPVDMAAVTQFPDVGKEFLQAVRVVPNEGGGMRVEAVDPNSLYGKLGLMAGDVVRNLDSIYLPTPEQKTQGMHPFNRSEIHLEVIRGGQPVVLTAPAERAAE